MVDLLERIEEKVGEHQAFLSEVANKDGVSLEEMASALLKEVSTISTSGGALGSLAGAQGAAPTSQEPQHGALRDDAIQAALATARFRHCALSLASLDLETDEGRRGAFDAAFSSGSALIVRVLAHGSAQLARRHPLLAQLHELRGELYSYFNHCQVVDRSTGEVSTRARKWSWTEEDNSDDTQLNLFLKQRYAAMDWVNPPLGALGWRAVFTGQRRASVDQRDHYVIVSILEEVRDFGERTFTAFGLPTDVAPAQGFSWRTFFDFYIDHVKCARTQGRPTAPCTQMSGCRSTRCSRSARINREGKLHRSRDSLLRTATGR